MSEMNKFYLVVQPEVVYTRFAHQDFFTETEFAPAGKFFIPFVKEFSGYHSLVSLREFIRLTKKIV